MNNYEELIREVKSLIGANRTEKALNLLAKSQLSELDKDLIILNSRYSKVKEDQRIGVIADDLAQRKINTINRDLLDLSEKIGKKSLVWSANSSQPLKNEESFDKKWIIIPVLFLLVAIGSYLIGTSSARDESIVIKPDHSEKPEPIEPKAIEPSPAPKTSEKVILPKPKPPIIKSNPKKAELTLPSPITIKSNESYGTFMDTRDNQQYKWVRLKDGKKWMAENLNHRGGKHACYNGNNNNCNDYGSLYTWANARIVCPQGWYLPSEGEWSSMVNLYGDSQRSYSQLTNNAFLAKLGGMLSDGGDYSSMGTEGIYWMNTESSNPGAARYIRFGRGSEKITKIDNGNKNHSFSCRCIKE